MQTNLKNLLLSFLNKGLLIDLEDSLRAASQKAFTVIRDHTTLNRKRAREAEGQIRFRMMEQDFEKTCELHGGRLLEGGIVPQTDLKIFQPFMRFAVESRGIILGLAAMPEPKAMPAKNKSRGAAVSLNYYLTPRLDFDGNAGKINDIFVLFLVARDRQKGGSLQEIAIGIIDSEYKSYVFYEPLDQFLSGYADPIVDNVEPITGKSATVTLKKVLRPFTPTEAASSFENDNAENSKDSSA